MYEGDAIEQQAPGRLLEYRVRQIELRLEQHRRDVDEDFRILNSDVRYVREHQVTPLQFSELKKSIDEAADFNKKFWINLIAAPAQAGTVVGVILLVFGPHVGSAQVRP